MNPNWTLLESFNQAKTDTQTRNILFDQTETKVHLVPSPPSERYESKVNYNWQCIFIASLLNSWI